MNSGKNQTLIDIAGLPVKFSILAHLRLFFVFVFDPNRCSEKSF
jgi:hypothetical protein